METKRITHFFTVLLVLSSLSTIAQLGVNDTNTPPAANAILDVKSASKGMYIPRLNTPSRIILSGEGMVVFDTDTKSFWFHNGTTWVNNWLNSGANIYSGNSGNVGIGTSSPTAKLDMNGSLKIVNGTQGSAKVLTSDGAGLATWQVLPTASGFPLNIPEIVSWRGNYAPGTSYVLNELVTSTNPNIYYYSLTNSNLAHTPESSPSFWQAVNFYQLKQIYKPLPLVLTQSVNLFSLNDASVIFRGKIMYSHSVTASGNGLALASAETDFQLVKSTSSSGSGSYTNPSSRIGNGVFSVSVSSPNFSFSSGIVSLSTAVVLSGPGQTMISNGIYFSLIPLGGQIGANSTPTTIVLSP